MFFDLTARPKRSRVSKSENSRSKGRKGGQAKSRANKSASGGKKNRRGRKNS